MRKRKKSYVDGGPIDPFYPFPKTPVQTKKYNYEKDSGIYDGPLLPAAEVTGKKPTFLREWGDIINEESKGAGLGEALFMTPLNAILSLPQLAATKLASDKTQRPSKALDLKDPDAQMVADIILDPLNLVGVGAVGKLAGLKSPRLAKEVVKDVTTRLNPLNLKTHSAEKWIKDWHNDPALLSKLDNRYPDFASAPNLQREISEDFQKTIVDKLNQYEPKNYVDLYKDKGYPTYSRLSKSSMGVSYGNPKSIYVNRTSTFPFNKKGLESTRAHELSHLTDNNGNLLRTKTDEKSLLKPFGVDDPIEQAFKKATGQLDRLEGYYTDPTEIRARLNEARFKLNLKPSDEFTSEMFDKISKEDDWFGMGRYIKDKKSFVDMANKMWAAPAAVAGGAALKNQEGESNYATGGYLQNNQMRKRKNYINGGFTGDPYQLAVQQALEASKGFNGLATDNTDIQQMAGGIAPLQLNGQSKIPTTPHEVPGMFSGLENVKMGDPASMAIQAAIGKATATAGDFVDAYKYKATLGPEKKRSDYNMDLLKGFASAGVFGMVPTMVRRRKDQNTMVAGSPGTYATGGPILEVTDFQDPRYQKYKKDSAERSKKEAYNKAYYEKNKPSYWTKEEIDNYSKETGLPFAKVKADWDGIVKREIEGYDEYFNSIVNKKNKDVWKGLKGTVDTPGEGDVYDAKGNLKTNQTLDRLGIYQLDPITPVKLMYNTNNLPNSTKQLSTSRQLPNLQIAHNLEVQGQLLPMSKPAYENIMKEGTIEKEYTRPTRLRPNTKVLQYAMGGQMDDQQLSSGAFQVKDDPNVTDGKHYPEYNANLDHNEVVDKNAKFVFSDELKNGKQTFAKEAAGLYKKIAAVENRKDPISQATAQQLNKQVQTLAMTQEQLAEALGLRNNKPQGMATGGFTEGPDDPIDPKKLISLGKNYFLKEDGNTGKELLYHQKNGQYFRLSPNEKKDFENSDYYMTTVVPKLYSIYQAMNDNVKVGYSPPINDGAGNMKPSILAYPFPAASIPTQPIVNPSSPTSATTPIAQQPTTGSGKPTPAVATNQATAPVNVDPADWYRGVGGGDPTFINGKSGPMYNVKNANVSLPTTKEETQAFQTWYNSLPGGSKLDVDGKMGPKTKKAFSEAGYDFAKIIDQANPLQGIVGPMSMPLPGDKQYVSVNPVGGKILPSSIGQPQNYPTDYTATPVADPAKGITQNPYQLAVQQALLAKKAGVPAATPPKPGEPAELNKFRQRQTLGDALQGVDVASKFFGLLRGPEVEPQILDNTPITKTTFDPMAAMYQNQRNFQNTANSLGTSSASTRRAVTNSMYANKLNADNQVMADYQNRNQQANTQYEQSLSQRRQRNMASQFNTNNLNAANRGQYDNTVQNAFTSLGNFGEALNKKQMSQDVLELLQLNYPKVYEGVMSDWEDIKGTKKKKTTKTTETTIE